MYPNIFIACVFKSKNAEKWDRYSFANLFSSTSICRTNVVCPSTSPVFGSTACSTAFWSYPVDDLYFLTSPPCISCTALSKKGFREFYDKNKYEPLYFVLFSSKSYCLLALQIQATGEKRLTHLLRLLLLYTPGHYTLPHQALYQGT